MSTNLIKNINHVTNIFLANRTFDRVGIGYPRILTLTTDRMKAWYLDDSLHSFLANITGHFANSRIQFFSYQSRRWTSEQVDRSLVSVDEFWHEKI
jgi:hypothetical protein